MKTSEPNHDQRIAALYLWVAAQFLISPPPQRVLIPFDHIRAIDAALTELFASRKKLSRKGSKAGRPAICLCGHKRHAAQCMEPECGCAEYVADARTGNAARKRKRARKENNR